ncbi:MAG: MATE family efflux transporter [Oscillospiraceae bacterium]|nr:MATE family efflux transporter [Oscillospiraceae bacterium]
MQLSLTEGKVSSLLIRFALPVILANLIQMAYGSINIFFLSWLASPSSLTGVSNGASLITTITAMFMGLASGGMILLGQYYGAKQNENAARAVGNIILLQAAVSVLSIVFVLSLGRFIMALINVPAEVDGNSLSAAAEAWNYMRVCVFGLVFQAGYNTVSAILRALGDSRTPLIFIAISCGINMALDYVFIGPMRMDARGAALATVVAQAVGFLISFLYIMRKKLPFAFSTADIRPAWKTLKNIFKLGIPIALQTTLNMLSFLAIAAIINNMGLFAAAANGIVNNAMNLYVVIPLSIGSALSAISAQNLGAGKSERAFASAKLGVIFSLSIAIPVTLFTNLAPTAIVSVLSPDPDVIKASAEFLVSFSWDCVLAGLVFCINGFFNGCGITTFVAVHEMVAAFAVRAPLSWLLSRIPGATLFQVGIGTPAASLVSLIMCLIYFKVKLSGGRLAKLRIAG